MMLVVRKKPLIFSLFCIVCACFVTGGAYRLHSGAKTFLPTEGHVFVIDAGHDADREYYKKLI